MNLNIMTPVSNYLNSFIEKEFKLKYLINNNFLSRAPENCSSSTFGEFVHLSIHSSTFIQQMILYINEAHNAWKHTNILEKDINFNDPIPIGKNNDFIPKPINDYIKKCDVLGNKIGKIYNFGCSMKPNNQSINLTIVYPLSNDEKSSRISKKKSNIFFKKCCYKIFLWLHVANRFRSNRCSKSFDIYIYMTDFFKLIPESNTKFDIINVNTAFTTSCAENTEINIFRQEEWFKVLIHETFHCFGLDFSHDEIMSKQLETQINELFNLNSLNLKVFETYCEINATLINMVFCCFFYRRNKKNKMGDIDIFKRLLIYEQLFSVFQCDKVLTHIGLKYSDFFDLNSVIKYNYHYEDYNVFVYYILKSLFLVHINHYIEWLVIYNNKSLLFNIGNEIDKQHFFKFIQNIVKNGNYEKIISELRDSRIILSGVSGYDSLIQHTMRMTLWELQ